MQTVRIPEIFRRLPKISLLIFLLFPFFLVHGQEWKSEWGKVLEAAKGEGQVVFYGSSR